MPKSLGTPCGYQHPLRLSLTEMRAQTASVANCGLRPTQDHWRTFKDAPHFRGDLVLAGEQTSMGASEAWSVSESSTAQEDAGPTRRAGGYRLRSWVEGTAMRTVR